MGDVSKCFASIGFHNELEVANSPVIDFGRPSTPRSVKDMTSVSVVLENPLDSAFSSKKSSSNL